MTTKKRLTDTICASGAPGTYYDHVVAGLQLRVGKKARSFEIRIERDGKRKFFPLGKYGTTPPALTLADARAQAKEMIERADAGGVERAAPEPEVEAPTQKTVKDLLDEYEAHRKRKGEKVKTLPSMMHTLRLYLDDFLTKPWSALTKAEIRTVRDQIADGKHKNSRRYGPEKKTRPAPIASNRFLGYLGPVMTWATSEEWDGMGAHPVARMQRQGTERKRDRLLTEDEMRAIWTATFTAPADNRASQSYGRLVRFLLVTIQRKTESSVICHGHVLDGNWYVGGRTGKDNKSSRVHRLKLPSLALAAMGEGAARDLAFPGRLFDNEDPKPLSGFSKLHKELVKRAGTDWWTLHDLRRTGATGMRDLLVPKDDVDAVQNHAEVGVRRNYFHDESYEAKAKALETWNAHLVNLLAVKPAAAAG